MSTIYLNVDAHSSITNTYIYNIVVCTTKQIAYHYFEGRAFRNHIYFRAIGLVSNQLGISRHRKAPQDNKLQLLPINMTFLFVCLYSLLIGSLSGMLRKDDGVLSLGH